jgi:N-acetylmuramoyl-L-alanine amidase
MGQDSMIQGQSPNADARPEGIPIDMMVLHYTGMESAVAALNRLCDPTAKVSAHYLIDEGGRVTALVDEDHRAWHAGGASWRGRHDINARSIGIELVNPGHELGYRPFPEPQMAALLDLAPGLLARHPIAQQNVVGHSDIAPRRKSDPGELFDWRRLAKAGIGKWPEARQRSSTDEADVRSNLTRIGYETDDLNATIVAFQRHFRPSRLDGQIDSQTAGLIAALARTP